MLKTFENITKNTNTGGKPALSGKMVMVREECLNVFPTKKIATIYRSTTIKVEHVDITGLVGITEVNGTLQPVKIDINELHKIDFGEFDARNEHDNITRYP